MKYFSMFSGIGGFELGILQAAQHPRPGKPKTKFECVGFSEVNTYATQIYQKHFPSHKNYGDASAIAASELPDFDLLVGGFPCQAFSIAGKRKGFDDARGNLFFDVARVLEAKRPRNFVLENVKGLLSHDGGKTFRTIIATLAGLGYCVEWQVLNSKDFGVPQSRERVYLVGHLGGVPRPEVFPVGRNDRSGPFIPSPTAGRPNPGRHEKGICRSKGGAEHQPRVPLQQDPPRKGFGRGTRPGYGDAAIPARSGRQK